MKDILPSKPLDHLLHPFVFVLKEGTKIQSDFLDYSLVLLQVGQAQTLPSPFSKRPTPNLTIQYKKK